MGVKQIAKSFCKILTPLNAAVPKKKDRILIYSNLGFRDNVRAMYEHLLENGYNGQYEIICSLDDWDKYSGSAPANVKFVSNLRGLFSFFTSKYMFYSFGKYPIKPSKAQKVVNLWHGMPLKTIGNLEKGQEHADNHFFTHTIATSPFFAEIMAKSFRCPLEEVLLTGQPRCDILFRKDVPKERLILWLPTYRTSDRLGSVNASGNAPFGVPLLEEESQLDKLNDLLEKADCTLLIKPHPLQNITEGEKIFSRYNRIRFVTQAQFEAEGGDLYRLFLSSSALLTDYSSAFFDYLLLDRPIGFTVDDFSAYQSDRGFVTDDPESLMAGEQLHDFEAFYAFVSDICSGIDRSRAKRQQVNRLVNESQTGNAAAKILNAVGLKKQDT